MTYKAHLIESLFPLGDYEKNLPAVENQTQKEAWVPRSASHAWGPPCSLAAEKKGKKTSDSLMARPFAFAKEDRLAKEREFKTVLKKGGSLNRPPIRILFLKKDAPPSRLGIWVSKRDFKTAVGRNSLKRWAREFFRKRKRSFLFPCDLIIQIRSKPATEEKSSYRMPRGFQALETILKKALEETGLLKP